MPTCAEVFARTLRDAGVTRMFGLPGGEILHFIEAARRVGIEFLLTRHEATASLMADAAGHLTGRPGVSVSTLGPGAVNLMLGVANAYLDRAPLIAVTASLAQAAEPYATHQRLDLNAVYRPFTKMTLTLDGKNTARKVREAYRAAVTPRRGPVHIALPSDVARREEPSAHLPLGAALSPDGRGGGVPATSKEMTPQRPIQEETEDPSEIGFDPPLPPSPAPERLEEAARLIQEARRSVVILGLDVDPRTDVAAVRAFVSKLGLPTFTTPKAKGILPEDHPLFFGVCGGLAGDAVIVDFFGKADLLIGVGFEPVESDKLWHHTMKLLSLTPVSVAAGEFHPHFEVVGDLNRALPALGARSYGAPAWTAEELAAYRRMLEMTLRPAERPKRGVSPYELTRRLRELFPRDTILATDVGSIKLITSQAWASYEPLTFLESNGLSAMSYSFAAAMAAKLQFPDRPVLCTIGDGGFGMTFAEIETCARHGIPFVTVVYNDSALSLIQVSQENKGYSSYGVEYGEVDFAAASLPLGAWARRVETLEQLDAAVKDALRVNRPAVIDVIVDPREYRAHAAPTFKA